MQQKHGAFGRVERGYLQRQMDRRVAGVRVGGIDVIPCAQQGASLHVQLLCLLEIRLWPTRRRAVFFDTRDKSLVPINDFRLSVTAV